MRIVRNFPFITYAICCILSLVLIRLLGRAGGGYDDQGIGTAAFLLKMLWNIFAFPFFLSAEFLFSLNGGVSFPGLGYIALAMGIFVCVLADMGLRVWRAARNRPK